MTFWAMMRLVFAWMGYLGFKLFGEDRPKELA